MTKITKTKLKSPYRFNGYNLRIDKDEDGFFIRSDFDNGISIYSRRRYKDINSAEKRRDDLAEEERYHERQDIKKLKND